MSRERWKFERPWNSGRALFPLRAEGELITSAGTLDAKTVVNGISRSLMKHRPKRIVASEQRIEFRGGPFRPVWSMNLLVSTTRGRIDVSRQGLSLVIRYELEFTELCVVGTFLVGWVVLAMVLTNRTIPALLAAVPMWLFLVGGNWATARARFRSFIARSIDELDQGLVS